MIEKSLVCVYACVCVCVCECQTGTLTCAHLLQMCLVGAWSSSRMAKQMACCQYLHSAHNIIKPSSCIVNKLTGLLTTEKPVKLYIFPCLNMIKHWLSINLKAKKFLNPTGFHELDLKCWNLKLQFESNKMSCHFQAILVNIFPYWY